MQNDQCKMQKNGGWKAEQEFSVSVFSFQPEPDRWPLSTSHHPSATTAGKKARISNTAPEDLYFYARRPNR